MPRDRRYSDRLVRSSAEPSTKRTRPNFVARVKKCCILFGPQAFTVPNEPTNHEATASHGSRSPSGESDPAHPERSLKSAGRSTFRVKRSELYGNAPTSIGALRSLKRYHH